MSKLFEKIILNRISDNLVTNPNQFAFKPKHNTEMCIFAILKYRALNSNVYRAYIHASKAFDCVNHSVMSNGFNVSNGVRQGGILSRTCFVYYVDELSGMLHNVNAGCFVGASLVTDMPSLTEFPGVSRNHSWSPGLTELSKNLTEFVKFKWFFSAINPYFWRI